MLKTETTSGGWLKALFHQDYNPALIVVLLVVGLGAYLGVTGWRTQEMKVQSVTVYLEKGVLANFSDHTVGIDFDGDIYQEVDTWQESASLVWQAHWKNDTLVYSTFPKNTLQDEQAYPDPFPVKNMEEFEKFVPFKNVVGKVHLENGTHFNFEHKDYAFWLSKVGSPVSLRFWHGRYTGFHRGQ